MRAPWPSHPRAHSSPLGSALGGRGWRQEGAQKATTTPVAKLQHAFCEAARARHAVYDCWARDSHMPLLHKRSHASPDIQLCTKHGRLPVKPLHLPGPASAGAAARSALCPCVEGALSQKRVRQEGTKA